MNKKDGLLFIGDPHLEARIPGFRKDDYPQVAVAKFAWCLQYARQHNLQPILLGDLFHLPQDNPNWLLSRIIETISDFYGSGLPAIYGNHDVRENSRKPNDSVSILFAGGHLRLLSEEEPWIGSVEGRRAIVGGTVWGEKLPREFAGSSSQTQAGPRFQSDAAEADLVAWITHHDILIPGYEELNEKRIQAQTNLKNAEKQLKSLQSEAEKDFGTSDIDELTTKLKQMETENEKQRSEYQALLDKISGELAEVENATAEKGSDEA